MGRRKVVSYIFRDQLLFCGGRGNSIFQSHGKGTDEITEHLPTFSFHYRMAVTHELIKALIIGLMLPTEVNQSGSVVVAQSCLLIPNNIMSIISIKCSYSWPTSYCSMMNGTAEKG